MAKTLWEKIEAKFADLKAELLGKTPGVKDAASEKLISDLQEQIEAGTEENAGQGAQLAAKDKTIGELNAKIADHEKTIKARDLEITTLKAADKSAGEKAADLVAAAGLDAAQLPAAGVKGGAAVASTKTLKEQYLALAAVDSIKAAAFYAEHADKKEFWK